MHRRHHNLKLPVSFMNSSSSSSHSKRSRVIISVAVVAALVLVGILAVVLFRGGNTSSTPAASAAAPQLAQKPTPSVAANTMLAKTRSLNESELVPVTALVPARQSSDLFGVSNEVVAMVAASTVGLGIFGWILYAVAFKPKEKVKMTTRAMNSANAFVGRLKEYPKTSISVIAASLMLLDHFILFAIVSKIFNYVWGGISGLFFARSVVTKENVDTLIAGLNTNATRYSEARATRLQSAIHLNTTENIFSTIKNETLKADAEKDLQKARAALANATKDEQVAFEAYIATFNQFKAARESCPGC